MSYPMTPQIDAARADALMRRTRLNTASPYQVAIFDHVDTNVGRVRRGNPTNLVVQAVAGSGKTTTIVAAARLIPEGTTAQFLAFNRHIALELKDRLPEGVECRTLNALGMKIIAKYLSSDKSQGGGRVDIDHDKVWKIIRRLYTKFEVKEYGADVKWLVGMCKSLGIVPSSVAADLQLVSLDGRDDSDGSLNAIVEHFDYPVSYDTLPTVFRMAREVLATSCQELRTLDFDDQKYLPVVMRPGGRPMHTFPFQVTMVDEVQDVNAVDIALIDLASTRVQEWGLRRYGKSLVIGVGDDHQSIYGFRGADTMAFQRFKTHFDAVELPLSITYRCAKSIVRYAQEVYSDIEFAENAIEGEVNTGIAEYDHQIFKTGTDMVICRNNAPVVQMAYRLIAKGIPVYVAGRDIGKNLLVVLEKIEAHTTVELAHGLDDWYETQKEIILSRNPDDEAGVERLSDRYQTMMVFVKANTDGFAASVIKAVKDLFHTEEKEPEGKQSKREARETVVLSTMHKAKGLEAERVFILDSQLLYRFAVPNTWQYTQEKNLDNVARTRAKSYLGLISSKGWKKVA